jgi:glutamate dehydrogenase (NAD(P)+)
MGSCVELTVEDARSGFLAYLVVLDADRPLSFGGTRIDPSTTREMVRELADNMRLKLAGHGSPVGAAKAGLRASPQDPLLEARLAEFADGCREQLTSHTILGKDMGAKQWMIDAIYARLGIGQLDLARPRRGTARRPERLCDLEGYQPGMTGRGVVWSIEQALGGDIRDARVLIQGFGVVGSAVARYLSGAGARVIGVSDRAKAVHAGAGLSLEGLIAAADESGLVNEARLRCTIGMRDELLAHEADVLVLAAGSYVLDVDVAWRVRSPLIVEAANAAITDSARVTLHRRGIRVIPDVVANSASAALAAHQIASGNTRSPAELWASIERSIRNSTDEVERISQRLDIDSKAAFRRVFDRAARPRRSDPDERCAFTHCVRSPGRVCSGWRCTDS